jgi:hypothetical protein
LRTHDGSRNFIILLRFLAIRQNHAHLQDKRNFSISCRQTALYDEEPLLFMR